MAEGSAWELCLLPLGPLAGQAGWTQVPEVPAAVRRPQDGMAGARSPLPAKTGLRDPSSGWSCRPTDCRLLQPAIGRLCEGYWQGSLLSTVLQLRQEHPGVGLPREGQQQPNVRLTFSPPSSKRCQVSGGTCTAATPAPFSHLWASGASTCCCPLTRRWRLLFLMSRTRPSITSARLVMPPSARAAAARACTASTNSCSATTGCICGPVLDILACSAQRQHRTQWAGQTCSEASNGDGEAAGAVMQYSWRRLCGARCTADDSSMCLDKMGCLYMLGSGRYVQPRWDRQAPYGHISLDMQLIALKPVMKAPPWPQQHLYQAKGTPSWLRGHQSAAACRSSAAGPSSWPRHSPQACTVRHWQRDNGSRGLRCMQAARSFKPS